jgi:hypothetical protein
LKQWEKDVQNKLLIFFLFLFSTIAFSSEQMSQRRCLLLPVHDEIGGAVAFKVFSEVENYLKEADWCYYRSNSEILNILNSYKKNLESHLENPDVLELLAQKTYAGSLIKVEIINDINGAIKIQQKIIGGNGRDILFTSSIKINKADPELIARTVINSLNEYEKAIPYAALVTGVVGNSISIDMGKQLGMIEGQKIIIKRPIAKKQHPFLKQIVDWEVKKVGEATVAASNPTQAQANMLTLEKGDTPKIGDWVTFQSSSSVEINNSEEEIIGQIQPATLGEIIVSGHFGQASATSTNQGTLKKMGGITLGAAVEGEVWITRNYYANIEILKSIGSLSKKEGTLATDSNTQDIGLFNLRVGYKYLPMGFFYGPQVNLAVGYGTITQGMDAQTADGFLESSYGGLTLNVGGSLPFKSLYRVYAGMDMWLSPSHEDTPNFYPEAESTSAYIFYGGVNYKLRENMKLDSRLRVINTSAKFTSPEREVKATSTLIQVGVAFAF